MASTGEVACFGRTRAEVRRIPKKRQISDVSFLLLLLFLSLSPPRLI